MHCAGTGQCVAGSKAKINYGASAWQCTTRTDESSHHFMTTDCSSETVGLQYEMAPETSYASKAQAGSRRTLPTFSTLFLGVSGKKRGKESSRRDGRVWPERVSGTLA